MAALTLLGGAARRSELEQHGVGRAALAQCLSDGSVRQDSRGAFWLHDAEGTDLTRAVRLSAVLSCGSAAVHHGLDIFGATGLHLSAKSPRVVPRSVVVHRLRSGESIGRCARATPLLRTLRDCCRCLPVTQSVSVLDSALRAGRVEPDELAALVPGGGPDLPAIRRAVRLVDPQAQSVLESAARVLLVSDGLGPLRSQVHVEQVGWVDFLLQDWLVIEVDGYAVHRERFDEDRRRDAELVRQGYVVLRFTYRDIERRPQWVLSVVRETLRTGHRRHLRALDR